MNIKITPALIDHSLELFLRGKTLKDISAIVGVSYAYISEHLRARGIDTSVGKKFGSASRQISLEEDKIKSMYQNGISENQIAKKFGVTRAVIRRHLIKAQVQLRSQSEAEKLKWSQMTLKKRNKQVNSAHEACRGRKVSPREKIIRALSKEKSPPKAIIGIGEAEFQKFLTDRGTRFQYQAAIGAYNVDFLIGNVAVELTSNTGRFYKNTRLHNRVKYLLERNIKTLYVLIDCVESLIHFAKKLISDIDAMNRNLSVCSEYWVIRCCSQSTAVIKAHGGKFALIKAPVNFLYERHTRQIG